MAPTATAVYVVYATPYVDLNWLPASADVLLVLNDDSLDRERVDHPGARTLPMPGNVGFGAAVNAGLDAVGTDRVVVCNPDTRLSPDHWDALASASPDEVVTIPLVDDRGTPTSVVSAYPTPLSLLLTGYRLGRLLGRDSALRARLAPLLGRWGRAHHESLTTPAGSWPLSERWVSGAVASFPTERVKEVGGFDERYFLYLEDVDLCRRLADRFPGMRARVADVAPGVHRVGGTAPTRHARRTVDRHYLDSVRTYAGQERGVAWAACRLALAPRSWWLGRAG